MLNLPATGAAQLAVATVGAPAGKLASVVSASFTCWLPVVAQNSTFTFDSAAAVRLYTFVLNEAGPDPAMTGCPSSAGRSTPTLPCTSASFTISSDIVSPMSEMFIKYQPVPRGPPATSGVLRSVLGV